MGVDPFKCPECGSRMLNDLSRHGYRCLSCGNHEPFGHLSDGAGRDAGAEGGGAAISTFELPALERLAKVIAGAYTGSQITDLFRKAGLGTIRHDGTTKRRFLYAEFERIQERFGSMGVAKVLMAACSPQERLNGRDIREGVNGCLALYGLGIREDGEMVRTQKIDAPPDPGARMFDQRNYHPTVIEYARPRFVRGNHFGAVSECFRVLEQAVQEKSGLDDYGGALMSRAFAADGPLEVDLPGLGARTRRSVQAGLAQEFLGAMSSVRNPVSHKPEDRLRMGRDDALEILGTLSRLFRVLDAARRRQPAGE